MRVRYSGGHEVAVPGIPLLWQPGQEAEIADAVAAHLLRNVWFSAVPVPDPPAATTPATPAPERRTRRIRTCR